MQPEQLEGLFSIFKKKNATQYFFFLFKYKKKCQLLSVFEKNFNNIYSK